jgi:8-oxo-dGTP pyrophosphatase MutT (NUDIX family)
LNLEKIEEKLKEALKEGRAIATGIGIFGAIFAGGNILLRRRIEKGSLIYPGELSGKWELPGGIVELSDFGEEYQSVVKNALLRELEEEVGLKIDIEEVPIVLLPAILKKSSIEKRNLIDWAFVVPINVRFVRTTPEYCELEKNKEISWIDFGELKKIEIVSERMRYLIDIAINYHRSLKTN